MACELELDGLESRCGGRADERVRVVTAQVPEPTVVTAVRGPEHGRDVLEGVRNGHPRTSTRAEHARQLPPRRAVVGNVLQHGDRECRAERLRRERQPLRRAADPQRPLEHALGGREAPCAPEPVQREVAANGTAARAGGLDHGVPGAADADVHERLVRREDARWAQPLEIRDAPVLELVPLVAAELRVEVGALTGVLLVRRNRRLLDEDRDAVHDAIPVAALADSRVADHHGGATLRAAQQRGETRHWRTLASARPRYRWRVAGLSLSVVLPVRNEAGHLPATVRALLAALEGSGFDAELVLVDDGSDDGSASAAREVVDGRLPFRVVRREGDGRFAARRAGLEAATGDFALLLDARVALDREALRFLRSHAAAGEDVWNAHVHVDDASTFGVFWRLLAELAWRDYFDAPRTTSFGLDEFDRFPKGTTCFFAPREVLLSAFDAFGTRYRDPRLANDDTPILRDVAARTRIGIRPDFSCTYAPRTSLGRFLRHACTAASSSSTGTARRSRASSRSVVAFFPVSAALAVAALRRPLVLPVALRRSAAPRQRYGAEGRPFSTASVRVLATVTPLYAAAHGAGMWRGAFELLRGAAAR